MSVSIHGLNFFRKTKCILSQIQLQVVPGKLMALVGPNGCGKSTLLHLICGSLTPNEGSIHVDGKNVSEWSSAELAKRRAMVSQSTQLSFNFKVLEVVLMGRSPQIPWMETQNDIDIAREALALCDVAHLEKRSYTTLSGGEQQRVQVSRALAQIWDPPEDEGSRYLFLDEPTSSLDPAHQELIMTLAQQWAHERGIAVCTVLHDINLACHYADQLVALKDGKVHKNGAVNQVLSAKMMKDVYGVDVNIIPHPENKKPIIIRRSS